MEIWNIVKLTILFVVLALLGFNIFTYLAKGTDILGVIFKTTGKDISRGARRTLEYVGLGTKKIGKTASSSFVSTKDTTKPASPLYKAVNDGKSSKTTSNGSVRPDSSSDSEIQRGNPKGWCYIGHNRGVRSCIHVNNSNMCQSGKIYPSRAVCANPRLRYSNGTSDSDPQPYRRRRNRRKRRRSMAHQQHQEENESRRRLKSSSKGSSNGLESKSHNQWHSNQPPPDASDDRQRSSSSSKKENWRNIIQ